MEFLESQDSSLLLSSIDNNTNNRQDYLSEINRADSNSNLIFIDSRVNNYQSLLSEIQVDNVEVFLLDPTKDGIIEISQTIDHYQNIQSINIVSHGDVGSMQLGSTYLSIDTLSQYRDQLTGWSEYLSEKADLLFYSCNLAKGSQGLTFVESISNITGADIAASNNLTGNKQLGGDWELEVTTGLIEADLPFSLSAIEDFDEVLYTFTRSNYIAADVIDFTRLEYTYDTGYSNNFDILPSQATNQMGLRVRQNAGNMTQAAIDAFVNAIVTLKNTFEITDNGQRISIYDQFVATHFATRDAQGRIGPDGNPLVNPAHAGSAFAPWHRVLLYEFEKALQTVNPNVTLPYWDWTNTTTTFNTIFQNNFMGPTGTGGPTGNQVTTGFFSLANGWGIRRDLSSSRWSGINSNTIALTRNLGGGGRTLGTVTQVNTTLAATTYNTFRSRLEGGLGMHNSTHLWFNGIMGNVSGSPNDPMFWLLHANVDRIWAEWQLNNHWGNSFYPTSGQAYGQNLNDPLYPWNSETFSVAADLQDLLPNLPSNLRTISSNISNAVMGTGTIKGNLENNDVVSPGNSPGRLKINGDYTQTENGELTIEIAGKKAGRQYDVLDISGAASLDGILNIYFLNGFQPKLGDTFKFLKASDVTGDFDKINIFGLQNSYNFDLGLKNGTYYLKVDSQYQGDNPSQGFATTREQLLKDTTRNLYNPSFGQGIDHFLYGVGVHHGVGEETVKHIESMADHSQDSDWFMPLNIDGIGLLERIQNGQPVPELLYPPDHDHEGHNHEEHQCKKDGHGGHNHQEHRRKKDGHGGHNHQEHQCKKDGHDDHNHAEQLLQPMDILNSIDSLLGFSSPLNYNYQLAL
jgi:tyrosinase